MYINNSSVLIDNYTTESFYSLIGLGVTIYTILLAFLNSVLSGAFELKE